MWYAVAQEMMSVTCMNWMMHESHAWTELFKISGGDGEDNWPGEKRESPDRMISPLVSPWFQNAFISTPGRLSLVLLSACLSARENVKFLGGGPSAWPQRCGGRGRLNYSSAIANCTTGINAKWVSWKWSRVLAGPGFFELAVECANKFKSSWTPTSLRAPFKNQNPEQKNAFLSLLYRCASRMLSCIVSKSCETQTSLRRSSAKTCRCSSCPQIQ